MKIKMTKRAKIMGWIGGIGAAIAVGFLVAAIQMHWVERIQLGNLGYSEAAIDRLIAQEMVGEALALGFDRTVNEAAGDEAFLPENFAAYSEIDYAEQVNLTENVNQLLEKGYDVNAINAINKTATDEDVAGILAMEKVEDIEEYLGFDYAEAGKLARYVPYHDSCACSYEEAVTWVDIGLDRPFYEEAVEVQDFDETMLVNKYRSLPREYEPELVTIDAAYASEEEEQEATPETAAAFLAMAKAMEAEGMQIFANSSYRGYDEQEEIYEMYVKDYGEEAAKQFAALPGFSEHQTGYVIDIASRGKAVFEGTPEQDWVARHAQEYGFILRYPEGKERITGYNPEAWHYRYVGKELAAKIVESGLTYDEYYIRYLA